ncbi:MAG: hypothetical protein KR126chlam3_01198 [Chlamydiae bacterium]|nr:hypothetical protein [Chlamydiota bacterium]
MNDWKSLQTTPGARTPLGTSPTEKGANFALYAPKADQAFLGLFATGESAPSAEFPLQRDGDIWHVEVENVPQNCFYAFRLQEEWILDPFAKELNASPNWGEKTTPLLGKVFPSLDFDWEGDRPLHLPFETLILYEMHVRGFTQGPSSGVEHPGTFLGVIEKIPYLQKLGINAVELLPIFPFDETANTFKNPNTGDKLYNYWGYSTQNFFSPMAPYGSISEFKEMVKALHRAGIEVILDVVYNHVGINAFHLIDKETYFILDENGNHTNYTGCGNTINCNHPVVIDFILSSLHYFVEEMHVDGFRFDLASIFTRGLKGEVLETPPLIDAITNCPSLTNTKLIAEAWDCAGLYQVGSFPGIQFAEWNGKFRDATRRFLKGSDEQAGAFAAALCASPDLYEGKKAPYQSINFITAHDGFTLHDLVSYNEKHNEDNGEDSRDGNSYNESWNCGVEGSTDNPEIRSLRERQMRNFLLALTVAIGTPMFLMGDEYGHSRDGNNNGYCQDNQKNYFLWDVLGKHPDRLAFFQNLLNLRKKFSFLQRKKFLTEKDITWHGLKPNTPDWGSRLIAYTLHGDEEDLFIAFNAHFEPALLSLPPSEKKWKRLVDTFLENPPEEQLDREYFLHPHSSLLLLS